MITALAFVLFSTSARASEPSGQASDVGRQIEDTRQGISVDEQKQREEMARLFVMNKKIKDISQKQKRLSDRSLEQEGSARVLAQEVEELERKSDGQKALLNKRLRQIYQERGGDRLRWLFSSKSPLELEQNRRFLKLMADSDHRRLTDYLANLSRVKAKRDRLKTMVARLTELKREAQKQERELNTELRAKAQYLAEIKKSKSIKISKLKTLRTLAPELAGYAFFERKGTLPPPVAAHVAREFGTYVDPNFRFRLTHRGVFYSTPEPQDVRAIYDGRVVFASRLPGYGQTVIIDHGDNYYSVYAFATQVDARPGQAVHEGEKVARSGGNSPLFGPGLYFEIRHFTDAIDPSSWIKDSVIKPAEAARERPSNRRWAQSAGALSGSR